MEECPCGSGQTYETCCLPYHAGRARVATAEALMRARYAAFVKSEIGFLRETVEPAAREQFDEESARRWATDADWKGLEILSTEKGSADETDGKVEFIAHYHIEDKDLNHHEVARFRKEEGHWYFVDGRLVGVDPFIRDEPKVGRNDSCPCGSGKKFKKCCGG